MQTPPLPDLDLDFTYLVFQSDYRKNKIHLWIDGNKFKKTYRTSVFEAQLRSKHPELHSNVQQVLNTYSFYLISSDCPTVKKLDPSGKGSLYKDERNMYFTGKVSLNKKEESLVSSLYQMGFDPISEEDIKSMNIRISAKKSSNVIENIMNLLRKK